MKVLIAGDFCPRNRICDLIGSKDYLSIFSEVVDYINDADFSIVNFESTVVQGEGKQILKYGPNLRCTPLAVEAIKYVGFDAVTLANNHIYDFGEKGISDTLDALEAYKIEFMGGGKNIREASEIFYKDIGGKRLAIINCCEHEFSIATETSGGANPLNPIQQYYAIQKAKRLSDIVLVIIHGGHEHYQLPSPRMVETYRFFIDAGADAVVNHHQHCYSGYEVYKGKPIFYGIGNFLFDYPHYRNNIWNEGYMVKLDFNEEKIDFELYPYVQCDESPRIIPMNDNKREAFFQDIIRLNKIIVDKEKLKEEFKIKVKITSRNYTYLFQPIRGKFFSLLFNRGLVHSIVGRKIKQRIINYICCESHRDCLLSSLDDL